MPQTTAANELSMCWLLLLCRGQAWHGEWMAVPPCSVILCDPPHFHQKVGDLPAYLVAEFLALSLPWFAETWIFSLVMSSAYLSAHPRTNHEQPTRFQQGGSQGNTCRVCSWSLGAGARTFRWRCDLTEF